jgi:hypothetical protein
VRYGFAMVPGQDFCPVEYILMLSWDFGSTVRWRHQTANISNPICLLKIFRSIQLIVLNQSGTASSLAIEAKPYPTLEHSLKRT